MSCIKPHYLPDLFVAGWPFFCHGAVFAAFFDTLGASACLRGIAGTRAGALGGRPPSHVNVGKRVHVHVRARVCACFCVFACACLLVRVRVRLCICVCLCVRA